MLSSSLHAYTGVPFFVLSLSLRREIGSRSNFVLLHLVEEDATAHGVRIEALHAETPIVAHGIGNKGSISAESCTGNGVIATLHGLQSALVLLVPEIQHTVGTYSATNPITHTFSTPSVTSKATHIHSELQDLVIRGKIVKMSCHHPGQDDNCAASANRHSPQVMKVP